MRRCSVCPSVGMRQPNGLLKRGGLLARARARSLICVRCACACARKRALGLRARTRSFASKCVTPVCVCVCVCVRTLLVSWILWLYCGFFSLGTAQHAPIALIRQSRVQTFPLRRSPHSASVASLFGQTHSKLVSCAYAPLSPRLRVRQRLFSLCVTLNACWCLF
eukprot:6211145-Pleurochrysis_carterae.AAC.1